MGPTRKSRGPHTEITWARLSSIYGFKVKYDPVKYVNHTFRIILSTNESLNDVLDAVSIIVPFDWKYEDGIVTVIEK